MNAPSSSQRPLLRRLKSAALPLLALSLLGSPCHGQQTTSRDIKVPYSLTWGDSADKVREMLNAVKARETGVSEKSPGKMVLEAEGLGLGDTLLKKSLFTFKDGSLVEVELEYGDPAWDAEKTLDFFDRTRRRIDERYGPGTLLVNKVKEHPANANGDKLPKEMTYTLIIYQWNQPAVALELSFYSMVDQEKSYRLVSLHYKAP